MVLLRQAAAFLLGGNGELQMDGIKSLVARFYHTWNAHDRDGWLACCNEDVRTRLYWSVRPSALVADRAARDLGGKGMPATRPIGGATADSHGLSRSACHCTRRSANPQVIELQRHRLPKLTVRVLAQVNVHARAVADEQDSLGAAVPSNLSRTWRG